ncbi:hypothetical protein NEIG_01642 [Nematocida sp. ERTm5]|nr:hypothetical protein NEIG_01642 [Nematocida sp. ERTm5]
MNSNIETNTKETTEENPTLQANISYQPEEEKKKLIPATPSEQGNLKYKRLIKLELNENQLDIDLETLVNLVLSRNESSDYDNFKIIGSLYEIISNNLIVKIDNTSEDPQNIEIVSSIVPLVLEHCLDTFGLEGEEIVNLCNCLLLEENPAPPKARKAALLHAMKIIKKRNFIPRVEKYVNRWYEKTKKTSSLPLSDYLLYTLQTLIQRTFSSAFLPIKLKYNLGLFVSAFEKKNADAGEITQSQEEQVEIDLFERYNEYMYNVDYALILLHLYKHKYRVCRTTYTILPNDEIPKIHKNLLIALHKNWNLVAELLEDLDSCIDSNGHHINYKYLIQMQENKKQEFANPIACNNGLCTNNDAIQYIFDTIKGKSPKIAQYVNDRVKTFTNLFGHNVSTTDPSYIENKNIQMELHKQGRKLLESDSYSISSNLYGSKYAIEGSMPILFLVTILSIICIVCVLIFIIKISSFFVSLMNN